MSLNKFLDLVLENRSAEAKQVLESYVEGLIDYSINEGDEDEEGEDLKENSDGLDGVSTRDHSYTLRTLDDTSVVKGVFTVGVPNIKDGDGFLKRLYQKVARSAQVVVHYSVSEDGYGDGRFNFDKIEMDGHDITKNVGPKTLKLLQKAAIEDMKSKSGKNRNYVLETDEDGLEDNEEELQEEPVKEETVVEDDTLADLETELAALQKEFMSLVGKKTTESRDITNKSVKKDDPKSGKLNTADKKVK